MTQRTRDTLFQKEDKMETIKPGADNLEPYRQLIDLQKQMIELAQQHERTKRECTTLREQMLEEMIRPRRRLWSLRLETRWLKSLNALGRSGSWWTRNWPVLLLHPARQSASSKPVRANTGKF
jgi:predicted patatin/cPLA2 family phospholipase